MTASAARWSDMAETCRESSLAPSRADSDSTCCDCRLYGCSMLWERHWKEDQQQSDSFATADGRHSSSDGEARSSCPAVLPRFRPLWADSAGDAPVRNFMILKWCVRQSPEGQRAAPREDRQQASIYDPDALKKCGHCQVRASPGCWGRGACTRSCTPPATPFSLRSRPPALSPLTS